MAVYTKIKIEQVQGLLSNYPIVEKVLDLREISAGIENSNYFVEIESNGNRKCCVLTIFENLSAQELPFFLSLTTHLSEQGLPVPSPIRDKRGQAILRVEGKAAVLVPCLSGVSAKRPSEMQASQAALFLAEMHEVQQLFGQSRKLERDLTWMNEQLALLIDDEAEESSRVPQHDLSLLRQSITRYQSYADDLIKCPQGIVHGDFFLDNVLFDGDKLSGVIDFYHACSATLIYDLAVMVNDWAWQNTSKTYDRELLDVILESYQKKRVFTDLEKAMWPRCLELAALRFWISRLVSAYRPGYQAKALAGAPIKDPDEMKQCLVAAQAL